VAELTDVFLPPVVACPTWCTQSFHEWEQDGDDWVRCHEGPLPAGQKLGVSVTAFAEDRWHNGVLQRTQCPVIDGTPIDLDTWTAIPRLLEQLT
jgi:hypothetical protein